jgi:hypothetical protein
MILKYPFLPHRYILYPIWVNLSIYSDGEKEKTGNRSFDRFPSPHVSQTMFRIRCAFAPRLLTQLCFIRSQPDFGRILSLSASESHNRIVSSAPLDLIIVPQFRIVCQHFFIKK